jgi:mannose-6-phosphate isomerase-like protein (cupin superfamily)
MSVEGLILHHGEAHGVTLHQTRVDYLVTAEHSKQCSLFEFTVAPGFNTGAHYHTEIEEIFYVLEGELDLRCGERSVRGGPGTCVFVPPGAAHAFGNSGSAPGRMLLITAPPGHEKYFDELRDLIAKGGKPDPDALAKLRAKYDTVQLATLTPGQFSPLGDHLAAPGAGWFWPKRSSTRPLPRQKAADAKDRSVWLRSFVPLDDLDRSPEHRFHARGPKVGSLQAPPGILRWGGAPLHPRRFISACLMAHA